LWVFKFLCRHGFLRLFVDCGCLVWSLCWCAGGGGVGVCAFFPSASAGDMNVVGTVNDWYVAPAHAVRRLISMCGKRRGRLEPQCRRLDM